MNNQIIPRSGVYSLVMRSSLVNQFGTIFNGHGVYLVFEYTPQRIAVGFHCPASCTPIVNQCVYPPKLIERLIHQAAALGLFANIGWYY